MLYGKLSRGGLDFLKKVTLMTRYLIVVALIGVIMITGACALKNRITAIFKGPEAKGYDLTDNPWKGSLGAPVQVLVVSETKCVWCAKAHKVIEQARKSHGDKFYVVYNHYPLDRMCYKSLSRQIHPFSCDASYGAYCAQKQSRKKFWEYLQILYDRQSGYWNEKTLVSYAKEIGLDEKSFKQCIRDPATAAVIKQDLDDARKNGIRGVPTIYFNGKNRGNAAGSVESFVTALDEALSAVNKEKKSKSSQE